MCEEPELGHRMRCLIAILIAVLLGGCAYTMVENGEIRPQDLRRMMARTAATRGLPLPDELETRVIQREELPIFLRQILLDEWSDAELREAQEMMTTMGMWPGDLDLIDQSVRVQVGQIAGLYSPPRRTLYLVENFEVPEVVAASAVSGRDLYAEFVLSHEIVHALQHHAFPQLFELTSQWKDQDDAVLALHAAIEGDALRYGLEVITPDSELPSAEQFNQAREAQPAAGQGGGEAPAVLRYGLLFPYVGGYPMALAEAKHLLANPPISTEQVLHADKRHEPFWSISLIATQRALSSCTVVGANTMGEFLTSVLLRDHLGPATPPAPWEGWNGDRYLVARCNGRPHFIWVTLWDSEDDARQFQSAYDAIAAAISERGGLDAPPQTVRTGAEVVVFTAGLGPPAVVDTRVRVSELAELVAVVGG